MSAGPRWQGLPALPVIGNAAGWGMGDAAVSGQLVDLEGNPRSPIDQGSRCPKAADARLVPATVIRLGPLNGI